MTVGSVFTGIGGLDLGFERAGFDVRWMVERDPFCRAVLAKHWPGVPVYPDARMSVGDWRRVEPVDVIIGGFPCQDVSSAGLRRGLTGDRSGLWWCLRRAARVVRPRYLVVENVTGLLARGVDTVFGSLARLGFDAEWATIRASDIQAPHRRARVFIVAYPQRVADATSTRSQRRRPQQSRGGVESAASRLDRRPDAWRGWPARPGEPQHDWEPARTVPSRVAQSSMGALTDGLPADVAGWYRAGHEAAGNAVVPQVAEVVARHVLAIEAAS
jgi:DNA (cytosine-5)-methyltransferase 1